MKRLLSTLLIAACLTVAGCDFGGSKAPKEDHFSIQANNTVFNLDNENPFQIKISIADGAVLNDHANYKLTMYTESDTCNGEFIGDSKENVYYFEAHKEGSAVIRAKLGELVSDNFINVVARYSDDKIASNLQGVLDTTGGVVLGQEYAIGISDSEADQYRIDGADGILKINQAGKLEVYGIGQGKLKLLRGSEIVFDGRYTVYNSVLATKIKEDLISQGKIENKSSLVKNDLFAFIKDLDLSGELINDPSASNGVKYLTKLESLNLSDNNLSDASFISSISTLKHLNLANNVFSDISSIVENENLEYLDLSNNNLSEITKLQFLYKIKSLDLSDNKITDISPLSSSYSLISLKLNNNKIKNFKDSLSGLEDLTELYVGNCDIPFTDIISLKYLPNITALDISGTNPTLENLTRLTKLKKLILNNCNLSTKNVTLLNDLSNLEYLDISANDIDKEAYGNGLDAAKLNKITYLGIGGNAFDVIPGLGSFDKLETLDLSYSYNLTDISSLTGLPVKELILDNSNSIDPSNNKFMNMINSLENLEKLSIVGGFNFIDESIYNALIAKVEAGDIKLRFLDRDYIDKDTISNYKRSVIFSLQAFVNLCNGTIGNPMEIPDLGDSKQIILSLVNDGINSITTEFKFYINPSLSRLDIFGNIHATYNFRFVINDRKESSFTFGFHSFHNTLSVNEPFISAAAGSKVIITGEGESVLEGANAQSSPAAMISCYDVYLKYPSYPNSLLTIRGFAGANGANGKNDDTSDMSVKNGKAGKAGGTAITCNLINIRGTNVKVEGGKGGDGGKGGNSTAGPIALGNWRQGGKGGNGASGGTAVQCAKHDIEDQSVLVGGQGGAGGQGGQGLDSRASSGSNGSNGSALIVK